MIEVTLLCLLFALFLVGPSVAVPLPQVASPSPRPQPPSSPDPSKSAPPGPFLVACQHLAGDGVPKDPHRALYWFRIAARDLRYPPAALYYAHLAHTLSSPQDYAEAQALLRTLLPELEGTPYSPHAQAILGATKTEGR